MERHDRGYAVVAAAIILFQLHLSDGFTLQQRPVFLTSRLQKSVTHKINKLPFIPQTVYSQPIFAKKKSSSVDDDDDIDIPTDWNEDEILAEFEDLDNVDDDEDVSTGVVPGDAVMAKDDASSVINEDDDDEDIDEDDIDFEELNLDDDDDDEDDGEDIIEEEEEIVGNTVTATIEEEDEEEEEYEDFLDDDLDDPNYMRQKELVEQAIMASQQRAMDENFDPIDFMQNRLTTEQASILENLPMSKRIQELTQGMEISEGDIGDQEDFARTIDKTDNIVNDPYMRFDADNEENFLQRDTGVTDDEMEAMDNAFRQSQEAIETNHWDKVDLINAQDDIWDTLSNTTLAEMEDCLEEIGGSAYNVTRWLLYDLDFNVTNLLLAAVKHNPNAPILFQHWYPQLVTYSRYAEAQKRNFDFTTDDVQNADLSELERYYAGFGYDEIPTKAPAETGIISVETMDEEEIKMAALENWVRDVYNPEWDRKDFDDDDMQDEDNVFSEYFEPPQHPDLPTFEDALEDIEDWNNEMQHDPESTDYRNMMGQAFEYTVEQDKEFEQEFRGHLIIACTGEDADLEVAEKITLRFKKEFGKQVYVETCVMALAQPEDNVFEIWLESYEIDLLHSKRRATSNTRDWSGPIECDDAQIEYLADQVRFLISDEARYSYRMKCEYAD